MKRWEIILYMLMLPIFWIVEKVSNWLVERKKND